MGSTNAQSFPRLAALSELGVALAHASVPNAPLPDLAGRISTLVDCPDLAIYFFDARMNRLHSAATQNTLGREHHAEIGDGPVGKAGLYREIVSLPDVVLPTRAGDPESERAAAARGPFVAVPILDSSRALLGVICAWGRPGTTIPEPDLDLLMGAVVQFGTTLEHRKRVEELASSNRQLLFLIQLAEEAGAARSSEELAGVVTRHACEALGASVASVLIKESEESNLFVRQRSGRYLDQFGRHATEHNVGLLGWVAEHGLPAISADPANDARCKDDYLVGGALTWPRMAVPLLAGRVVIGAIEVRRDSSDAPPPEFTRESLSTLHVVGENTARVLRMLQERRESERTERLADLGRTMASVAHDIRTPLTVISAHTELALEAEDRQRRAELCATIVGAVDEVSDLVTSLLYAADGRSQVVRKVVEVEEIERMVIDYIRRNCESRRVVAQFVRRDGPVSVDVLRVKRILYNLARNAVDAMKGGGVLTICLAAEERRLRIEVSDTGAGLADSVRRNLFEPFVTHGKSTGTGLGLYIVRRCVEELGGVIEAESTQGKGTTFKILLGI